MHWILLRFQRHVSFSRTALPDWPLVQTAVLNWLGLCRHLFWIHVAETSIPCPEVELNKYWNNVGKWFFISGHLGHWFPQMLKSVPSCTVTGENTKKIIKKLTCWSKYAHKYIFAVQFPHYWCDFVWSTRKFIGKKCLKYWKYRNVLCRIY